MPRLSAPTLFMQRGLSKWFQQGTQTRSTGSSPFLGNMSRPQPLLTFLTLPVCCRTISLFVLIFKCHFLKTLSIAQVTSSLNNTVINRLFSDNTTRTFHLQSLRHRVSLVDAALLSSPADMWLKSIHPSQREPLSFHNSDQSCLKLTTRGMSGSKHMCGQLYLSAELYAPTIHPDHVPLKQKTEHGSEIQRGQGSRERFIVWMKNFNMEAHFCEWWTDNDDILALI